MTSDLARVEGTKDLARVEWTKNYEQFQMLYYNRAIMENSVNKLMTSMKAYGYLLPLLVNQDLYIVDGQHRLEAAKKLEIQVSYIRFKIEEEKLPILVAEVNTTSKNWSLTDHFNMWVSLERPVYLYVKKIIDEYDISIKTVVSIIGYSTVFLEKFKKGIIGLTDTQKEKLIIRCDQVKEIRELNIMWADYKLSGAFTSAIVAVLRHAEYNHDKMVGQLEKYPTLIQKSLTIAEYVMCFEMVYNKNCKNRVRFSKG